MTTPCPSPWLPPWCLSLQRWHQIIRPSPVRKTAECWRRFSLGFSWYPPPKSQLFGEASASADIQAVFVGNGQQRSGQQRCSSCPWTTRVLPLFSLNNNTYHVTMLPSSGESWHGRAWSAPAACLSCDQCIFQFRALYRACAARREPLPSKLVGIQGETGLQERVVISGVFKAWVWV